MVLQGFDKSVAKVSGFIVTSVSAFSERLLLCYLEKFTSVSLWRTLKSALIYHKGKGYYFSLLSLLWKGTEGISEEGKQVMKGKWSFWETPLQLPFFFFLYYDAKKFKYDLRDLSQHSPLVIHPYWGVSFFSPQPDEWGDVTGTYRHWHLPQPTKWNWHLSFASSSLGSQDKDSE